MLAEGRRIGQRKEVPRLELVTLEELERASVKLIRARLRLRADDPGGRTEFRVVIGRRHFGFSDGFECRIDDDETQQRIVIVRAVEQVRRPGEALAVDDLAIRPLWILARRRLGRRRLYTRGQQLESRKAPV